VPFTDIRNGSEHLNSGSEPGALLDFFSPDYATAKRRFVASSTEKGFEHHSLPVRGEGPDAERLTIDVAIAGSPRPASAVILSSGLHGVEGPFGSAVQLAFLEQLAPDWRPPADAAIILLHTLNPFGFAWRRRFNEDNVDLNRNFLAPHQSYAGAPPLTSAFRRVLAPRRWTSPIGRSAVGFGYLAMRHGMSAFWETLPVGQYEHDDWLCFGGRGRSECVDILDRFLPPRLDRAEQVVHLDYHTGLGRWGTGELLLPEGDSPENIAWWKTHFNPDRVRGPAAGERAYEVRGGLGEWLQTRFPNSQYRFATAEFGTYSPFHILKALVEELHLYTTSGAQSADHPSRRRLRDAFVPPHASWRAKTLRLGLEWAQHAVDMLSPAATNS
jgi:Protein of unknown function (DUF2817)